MTRRDPPDPSSTATPLFMLPAMSEGCVRVLHALGPDLEPWQWAAHLEIDVAEVTDVLDRLDTKRTNTATPNGRTT